ncbi:MAG: hypothetical protein KDK33_13820, partial [Leptospiraceae bacterium]|nr:hypothetical protein [Leptospiraceae bacterium]
RLNLALIDLNENKSAQARKSLEEIARLYPRFSDPHYHLAFLDYEGGNYRGALSHIDRAIELEKTSEYYLARARILEKIPGKTAQLQETYRSLLQDFPNLSASDREQVRTKMSRLANGDARALSPLEMPAVDPVRVFRHRDLIIYQEKNRIVAAKIGSERPQYIQTFSGPIMDSNQSYWVYVALRNEVITLDPTTGEIVDRWEIANVCRLLGDLGDMAVVTGSCGTGKESALKHLGKSAEDRLLSPRDFNAVSPGTFYYAGGFYQAAKTGNAQTMTRINWEGESVKAMLPVTSIIGLERQDSALVLATADALLVLDPDTLEVDKRTKMAVRSLEKTDNHLFIASGNELHQWKDGKLSAAIRLPAPVRDGQTIHAIGDDRILYIGTDGALRLLDTTGKVLWKENPGKFDSRLLSVYY